MNRALSALVILALVFVSSCSMLQTRKQKGTAAGAAVGAAAGAGLGQAIGRDTASTLWGAAIGAVVGGIAGHEIAHYMDQQEQQLQEVAARSDAMSVARTRMSLPPRSRVTSYLILILPYLNLEHTQNWTE